ncbi:hypothetical protein KR51_00007600 [Rubidibacter lacunae KORDI 51-2]|uniref:Uncharacterized protein n=1 Tax=Rubidibacter lacunae KORDI 51-2 TaxID=582515 RepID=U5DD62_9CHRO|nr:hypothetical protein [Rubidibacter lacunae]ERN42453.1 hypothetical protein KR51_00007600 [Rubidibacter lacunae KORDI 51-2]
MTRPGKRIPTELKIYSGKDSSIIAKLGDDVCDRAEEIEPATPALMAIVDAMVLPIALIVQEFEIEVRLAIAGDGDRSWQQQRFQAEPEIAPAAKPVGPKVGVTLSR